MGLLSRKKKAPKKEVEPKKEAKPKAVKRVKVVAWKFQCDHPRLSGTTRKRIGPTTPSIFCNTCNTKLVFKEGKVFGLDGKIDPHHTLTALAK